VDRGPICEYRHVARIYETRFVSPSLLGLLLEHGHQCRDYVLKFSIGHATWRPLRGHLSRAAEMDDMCNRVNRERATFSPIVPIDVGSFVVYTNGVYLSGIREAPARRDHCAAGPKSSLTARLLLRV